MKRNKADYHIVLCSSLSKSPDDSPQGNNKLLLLWKGMYLAFPSDDAKSKSSLSSTQFAATLSRKKKKQMRQYGLLVDGMPNKSCL